MRKRYRTKRGSCPLCHPEKTGHEPRWCPKELDALRQWELERLEWRGLRVPAAALEITAESRSPETYGEMYGEGAAYASRLEWDRAYWDQSDGGIDGKVPRASSAEAKGPDRHGYFLRDLADAIILSGAH